MANFLAALLGCSAMVACASAQAQSGGRLPQPRPAPQPALTAFPGAQGFGAAAMGGRGGAVYLVTNLADSGPGSLRACVQANEPRTCIFKVGGTITLASQLGLGGGRVTIAGQSAPGDGIALKASTTLSGDNLFRINRDDVVIRHVRFRRGPAPGDGDSVQILNAQRVMLDHVSISFGKDENLGISTGSGNITIQHSIIAEGLRYAGHSKGLHSMGSLAYTDRSGVTFWRNLFAHNNERNPRINVNGTADVVNNVIYNSGWFPTLVTSDFGVVKLNYQANVQLQGPDSRAESYTIACTRTNYAIQVYQTGNLVPSWIQQPIRDASCRYSSRHPAPSVPTLGSGEVLSSVLARVGALPRDAADARVIDDARNGSGQIIDDPAQVGGWPDLANGVPPDDQDSNGVSDAWEAAHGLDPLVDAPADRNGDHDQDGYTNLEEYLSELAGD